MSDILKVFTAEQLYEMMKNKILADNVGITNFNEGSRIRSILEAVALIESITGYDYLNSLRDAIKISFYEGFGFSKKPGTKAKGYIRFYRLPIMTINYTGNSSSVKLTITNTNFILNCSNTSHNVNISFTNYPYIQDIVDYLNSLSYFTAEFVIENPSGNQPSNLLFQYNDVEILNKKDYKNRNGFDILLSPATQTIIPSNIEIKLGDLSFETIETKSLDAGISSTVVLCECKQIGTIGNININSIDTLNGKGQISDPIPHIEHAINDSSFFGGTNEETEEERLKRFQLYIRSLQSGTEFSIKSAILKIPGVKSVYIKDNYPKRGYITLIVDNGTNTLPIELINEITKTLNGDPLDVINYPGYRPAGVKFNIIPPNIVSVNIDITIYKSRIFYNNIEVVNEIKSRIESYINTRKLGESVILSEIIKLAKSHPAIYDVIINSPTSNIIIDNDSVARTGSGTTGNITINLVEVNNL
jgi:uncharacterized phage protein gp47/JayE